MINTANCVVESKSASPPHPPQAGSELEPTAGALTVSASPPLRVLYHAVGSLYVLQARAQPAPRLLRGSLRGGCAAACRASPTGGGTKRQRARPPQVGPEHDCAFQAGADLERAVRIVHGACSRGGDKATAARLRAKCESPLAARGPSPRWLRWAALLSADGLASADCPRTVRAPPALLRATSWREPLYRFPGAQVRRRFPGAPVGAGGPLTAGGGGAEAGGRAGRGSAAA